VSASMAPFVDWAAPLVDWAAPLVDWAALSRRAALVTAASRDYTNS
jgi:hypothetical protein